MHTGGRDGARSARQGESALPFLPTRRRARPSPPRAPCQALLLLGRAGDAVRAFHEACTASKTPRNTALLAQALLQVGDPDRAREALQLSARQESLPPAVLVLQGQCYQQLDRFRDAWHCFDLALRTAPLSQSALLGRGACKNVLRARQLGRGAAGPGMPPQAMGSSQLAQGGFTDFSAVLSRSPRCVEAYLGRGTCSAPPSR